MQVILRVMYRYFWQSTGFFYAYGTAIPRSSKFDGVAKLRRYDLEPAELSALALEHLLHDDELSALLHDDDDADVTLEEDE